MRISNQFLIISSLVALSACSQQEVKTRNVLQTPLSQGECMTLQSPSPDYEFTRKDLGYVALADAETQSVEWNLELIMMQMDNIGIKPEHKELYLQSIKIHEECAHLLESKVIIPIPELETPYSYTLLGKSVIGFKGSEVIFSDKRFTNKTLSEFIAMSIMFNNQGWADAGVDPLELYGSQIPQSAMARLGHELYRLGYIDFYKVIEWLGVGTPQAHYQAMFELCGRRDPYKDDLLFKLLAILPQLAEDADEESLLQSFFFPFEPKQ